MNEQRLLDGLKHAIEQEIARAVEEAAERAGDEASAAVRARVGQIATRLASEIDFTTEGRHLVIHVRFEGKI